MSKYSKCFDKENLIIAVGKSQTYSETLTNIGLRAAGGNFKTLKKWISFYNIDISHFIHVNLDIIINNIKLHESDVLVENCKHSRNSLRRVLLENNTIEYKCGICGINSVWDNKPLTLQIDHINGVYNDNRLENLRWLCPNCHSQTDTFAGKKIKIPKTKIKKIIEVENSDIIRKKNQRYTKEFIDSFQQDYSNGLSFDILTKKYNISKSMLSYYLGKNCKKKKHESKY